MSYDDDDDELDPGAVPGPDDEPTAAERARARSFAELLDKVVAGRAPAAMPAEDRALIEVATVIRAASGAVELSAARRASIVEEALHRAVDKAPPTPSNVVSIASRRAKTPWVIAAITSAVAIAAILALFLRPAPRAAEPTTTAAAPTLPQHLRSRPADPLIGAIPRARSGDAAARIDAIFADRLDGFRELSFGGP